MIKIQVDARQLHDFEKLLILYPQQVNRALPRAINKTLRWANSQGLRAIAQAHDLPLKALRARRRSKVRNASRFKLAGVAWFGFAPIRASYLGTPRETKTGVRVGSHFFDDAFVATMPSGHVGVFNRRLSASRWSKSRPRTSSPNLPIFEPTVRLDAALAALDPTADALASRLEATFTQEMNYEINVRGLG